MAGSRDFYTTLEAARILSVSTRTVQLWVEKGVLPAWKTSGGHRRIEKAAVDTFVSQQRSVHADRKKVVIIEDDPSQAKLMEICVQAAIPDSEIIIADTGVKGLLEIGRLAPSIVVLDLRLPGMDGGEVLQTLASDSQLEHLKVVVTTSFSAEELAATNTLPDYFRGPVLYKPLDLDELRNTLQQLASA